MGPCTTIPRAAWGGLRRTAVLAFALLSACSEQQAASGHPSPSTTPSDNDVPAPGSSTPGRDQEQSARWAACRKRHEALFREPPLPGAPQFEARRVEMVGRVRGATVLFKREPRFGDAQEKVQAAVGRIESSRHPLDEVRELIRDYRKQPVELRSGLLREGYLYVRGVESALALVEQLRLTDLFREPTVFLLRDGRLSELRRAPRERLAPERYVHADGPLAGEKAEILFADRVGTDAAELLRDPLTIDFSAARQSAGFERIRKPHVTGETMAAEVRYGRELWVPVIFDVRGPSAKMLCQGLSADTAPKVEAARHAAVRSHQVQARIRQVVREQVREQLPFDAPRGGSGSDTDKFPLRSRWEDAYHQARRSYRHDGKRYQVYDESGRPLVPQVCIDFIFDTWERAAGTWYQPMLPRGKREQLEPAPKRIIGHLRIAELGLKNRRNFKAFVRYARDHPEHFDVWTVPPEGRVSFAQHEQFFASLAEHAEQFRLGDMLVLRRAKWDGRSLHHTVIVLETDPFTAIPTLVAGNAVKPRIQTLQGAMQLTPNRFVKYRIRPNPQWLDEAILRSVESR